METTRSEVRLPSGSEVEGAVLHGPWRNRITAVRSSAETRVSDANDRVRSKLAETNARVRTALRSNPTKWAGVAAGAGFSLGLVARMIRYRIKSRALPEVVVIDAC